MWYLNVLYTLTSNYIVCVRAFGSFSAPQRIFYTYRIAFGLSEEKRKSFLGWSASTEHCVDDIVNGMQQNDATANKKNSKNKEEKSEYIKIVVSHSHIYRVYLCTLQSADCTNTHSLWFPGFILLGLFLNFSWIQYKTSMWPMCRLSTAYEYNVLLLLLFFYSFFSLFLSFTVLPFEFEIGFGLVGLLVEPSISLWARYILKLRAYSYSICFILFAVMP